MKNAKSKRRERVATAVVGAAIMIAWGLLAAWLFVTWVEHPAEQPPAPEWVTEWGLRND